ncbi:hypothetical protein CNR22_11195 [Sphingobacteriaceae bacterium]|nr:hypothetical protein CNR22_11195 [Sphingobacteriaceae bacterium]
MRYFIFIILIASLKVSSQSSGGTLSSNTTVCQGMNKGVLTLTANVGTIIRWETSNNSTGPWVILGFNGNAYNYTNITQSSYFRVLVQLTGFPSVYSNTVLVNCDLQTVAGTIATNTLQCINTSFTSTLAGNTGSVISWQSTTNNWISTNTITSSNTTLATLSSLTTTTQVRAYIQNGVCPAVYTNTLTVNSASPSSGGTIGGTQSVCATSNSATLSLSNYLGVVQQWESASSLGGPYSIIASSTNTTSITYLNLTQNTWYRVRVQNANCAAATSPAFAVHVDQASNGGNITGSQQVCAATNSGTLQLLSNLGSVNHWEYSSDAGANWSVISNTNMVQTFSNIPSPYIYRVQVQNGLCSATLSSSFSVNVNPVPTVTFNSANGCKSSLLSFTNLTSGSNTYAWNFGDSGSSNNYHSSHVYSADGFFTLKLTATNSYGCIDSLKKTIVIYPQPSAAILSSDTACYGTQITFLNASTISSGNISTFIFNFCDGSTNSTLSPAIHFFPGSGTYSVSLKATSDFGCKDSTVKFVTIYPKPLSSFTVANVCRGSLAFFNNSSGISNGNLSHSWNFGNGNFSSAQSPSYTYPVSGTYSVSLISSSNQNCKDTAFGTITVNEKAGITSVINNACLGNLVNFNSAITPTSLNVSVLLSFGDGTSSSNITTSHNYTASGTYIATITALTDSGCVSLINNTIAIYSKPNADFNVNNACTADSVKYYNISNIPSGTLSYYWNLGVGTSLLKSPSALYSQPGNYLVTLIVKSNSDCYDTIEKPITIFDAPKVNFNFTNACNGFPITFTNATTVTTGIISGYLWDFGNNSTSSALNPSSDYLNDGTYTVTLIGKSSNGCTDTARKTVNVYEGPIAKFTASATCLNTAITFSNQSILQAGTYSSSWRFGDETTSDQNSPSHSYTTAASKKVWLKVTSANLCTDSTSLLVEVFSNPKITASRDTLIDKGQGISLTATGASTYNWFPLSGLNNPILKNPFANPDSTTTYFVEGTDVHGCKGTDTVTVKINSDLDIFIYNVVTPDNNGMNDTWRIKNIQYYPDNKVVIFDQWNQRIFEADQYNSTWEGKNQGGEILPDATYFYILTFKKSNKKYSGYITLIRNK